MSTDAETVTDADVEHIRTFEGRYPRWSLGVGLDRGRWFTFVRDHHGTVSLPWKMHCGPYSTRAEAVEWIWSIADA